MANMTFGVNILPKANANVTLGNSDNPWEVVSPSLTGTPTAPTATAGTSTTQVATTEFVASELSGYATKSNTVLDTTLSRGRKANTTVGTGSFAFGNIVEASGSYSHAEGYGTEASALNSHAEGMATQATKSESHAEGNNTTASGSDSHAEGNLTVASGNHSHAEGYLSKASGNKAHAECNDTTASGESSHAEGSLTIASGSYSHAEGFASVASAYAAHAENGFNIACADYTHAQGESTISNQLGMHTFGRYSYPSFPSVTPSEWASNTDYIIGDYVQDDGSFFFCRENHTSSSENMPTVNTDIWLEIGTAPRLSLVEAVGWGAGNGSRKNIRTLDTHGSETLYGTLYVNCDEKGLGGTEVATKTNATTTTAGLMSAADKTKLNGIATGATANTGDVVGPSSVTNNHVAIFNGATGKAIKDSGYTIATSVPSGAKFTDTNTWRGYQTKAYSYKYTASVSAGASATITGTNFGVSNPSGYTPVAIVYFDVPTWANLIRVNASVTGSATVMQIVNTASSAKSGFTVSVTILYLQT